MVNKPFSQASENNQQPILEVLQRIFADRNQVLEIGSGTGQHAVYFAGHLPHLVWQTSDRVQNHSGINLWLQESDLDNVLAPIELNVTQAIWPEIETDAVFSANTAHIMHWPEVVSMFAGVAQILCDNGLFVLYGPFNHQGEFTSGSNRKFEAWLKNQDSGMGIRDDRALIELGLENSLVLHEEAEMPANNRILIWSKEVI